MSPTHARQTPRCRLPWWDLLGSRTGRMTAFFFLYVTEGIPLGFTAVAIATYMRREGVAAGDISKFVGMLYLPWSWKWLIGPLVDTIHSDTFGRRRVWIAGAQSLMVVMLLLAMPIDYTVNFQLFCLILLLLNVFSATQDVAIDALAVNVIGEDERGLINGMMFSGAYVGNIIGGAGVLWLVPFVGLDTSFMLVAGSILAVMVLVTLTLREGPDLLPSAGPQASAWKKIASEIWQYLSTVFRSFLSDRAAFFAMLFALLPTGGMALSMALAATLQVEIGLSDSQIATLTALTGVIMAGCCILGGYLSDKFGRRRLMAIYVLCLAVLPLVQPRPLAS